MPIWGSATNGAGVPSEPGTGYRSSFRRCRGDEAGSGEVVGTDLAAGVEVVPLVPAVVRHLVAPVGLDQGVQQGADADGIVGNPALGGCRMSSHGARAPFVGLSSVMDRSGTIRSGPESGESGGPVEQGPLVHLQHRGEGKAVHHHQPVGGLVVGQCGPGRARSPASSRASSTGPSSERHHECHPDLTQHRVGSAHHRHLGHRRVAAQHRLHLGRIDVVAAPDVELVGPADQVEVAGRGRRNRSRRS